MDHPIKVKSKRRNRPIASVFNCFLDGGTTVQSRAKSDSSNRPESSTPTDRSPKNLAIENVKAPSPSLDDEHPRHQTLPTSNTAEKSPATFMAQMGFSPAREPDHEPADEESPRA
jgi:hypothetical protein